MNCVLRGWRSAVRKCVASCGGWVAFGILSSQYLAGPGTSSDDTSLGELPNPDALEGFGTARAREHTPATTEDGKFSLETPLVSLLQTPQTKVAISVDPVSPPIPAKLAEKIWSREYIELQELLPARLGAPGPTVLDALLQSDRVKQKKTITTIQDWVVCFNAFISVVALRDPSQVRDLLAYSSTIIKASQDFEGTPWLEYDVYFRRQIATQKEQRWERIDASIWTLCFTRATPKSASGAGKGGKFPDSEKRQNPYRFNPYPSRVCFRWNSYSGCQLMNCKFLHSCSRCRETSHTAMECPLRKTNPFPTLPRSQDQPPPETTFHPPTGRR